MTSHDVVRAVRRICHTRKVGHAGTLDPLATGVLPVAVGQGTKILQFLLAENKSYRATFRLGVTTDTLDIEGQILAERPVPPDFEKFLEPVCRTFRGEIDQLPPMFSALKQNGVPLYKLARQGKEVERKSRRVVIDRLEIVSVDGDQVVIDVDCSKGTYIRSLVNDIGEQLGCGACLTALCRTRSGDFSLSECIGLDALRSLETPSSVLLSPFSALRSRPGAELTDAAVDALKFGIPPQLGGLAATDETMTDGALVRLSKDAQLLAVARFSPMRDNEKRGDFELIRVFVSP
jgi:tRNA pseudouridine55 synthase